MDQHLAHGQLLKGVPLPILALQRKGVVRGRVEKALDLPASPRGLVLVEHHRGSGSGLYGLYPGPVEFDTAGEMDHHPAHD